MCIACSATWKGKFRHLTGIITFLYAFREEELYQILVDIMRSPEMIKALCGSSLKKKLE